METSQEEPFPHPSPSEPQQAAISRLQLDSPLSPAPEESVPTDQQAVTAALRFHFFGVGGNETHSSPQPLPSSPADSTQTANPIGASVGASRPAHSTSAALEQFAETWWFLEKLY